MAPKDGKMCPLCEKVLSRTSFSTYMCQVCLLTFSDLIQPKNDSVLTLSTLTATTQPQPTTKNHYFASSLIGDQCNEDSTLSNSFYKQLKSQVPDKRPHVYESSLFQVGLTTNQNGFHYSNPNLVEGTPSKKPRKLASPMKFVANKETNEEKKEEIADQHTITTME